MTHNSNILKLYCQQHNVELVSEYKFLSNRQFKSDFAIPKWKILIEIEGGLFPYYDKKTGKMKKTGAHSSIKGMLRDLEKYNLAAQHGYTVFRVTPAQFKKSQAIEWIEGWRSKQD